MSWKELSNFYRRSFPAAQGWTEHPSTPDSLCLIKHPAEGLTAVLELRPYAGSRVVAGRSRYLVVHSNVEEDDSSCGAADPWISLDLLE